MALSLGKASALRSQRSALSAQSVPVKGYSGVSRGPIRIFSVAEAEKISLPGGSGNGVHDIPSDIALKLRYQFGKISDFSSLDVYHGTAWSVRERLIDSFEQTQAYWKQEDPKFVYYLSAEFLMGRSLTNTVFNLGLEGPYADALRQLGYDFETIAEQEKNASLGNGGLGRLAACFLDSMATLDLPGWGYGIRYRYGMFKQVIDKDGGQHEIPDIWLTLGNPWEIRRPDIKFLVGFGGRCEKKKVNGKDVTVWVPSEQVNAVAYDNPIPGYQTPTTSNLRLWDAAPIDEFDLTAFNAGEYDKAMLEKERAEGIVAVLYPNDSTPEGKELRLKQQYFFVSASIQDVIARFKSKHSDWELFPTKACFQLNDTHPTIAVAELMRILVDLEGLEWDKAWTICTKCLNYTNHTVMPEALEKWPVKVMAKMLPRHMEIIEIINEGWKKWLTKLYSSLPAAELKQKVDEMSIIHENQWNKEELLVNMAYLAVVGSSAVNGVAAIHSEIVKDSLLNDFYKVFPEKFQNKTNGVTPRRWLAWCNPELSALITSKLGSNDWINNLQMLRQLEPYASDPAFQAEWRAVKRQKKAKMAELIKKISGDDVSLDALYDIQIKRIHEYKRQHLNIFSIIWRYKQLKKMTPEERLKTAVPRVCLIGGKAASAYELAKRIIKLVGAVGKVINNDPDTKDFLRLYFLPDYNVSLAETIIPAAEVSQHISTAGTEASGTSNMKFQLNGCLILGTMDGANIEIAEESGKENMFVFGVDADDVTKLRKERKTFKTDPRFDEICKDIESGMFGDKEYFKAITDAVYNMKVGNDWFLLANDFPSYLAAQEQVDKCYRDQAEWTRRSIMYTAGGGKFSSDRTIYEYAQEIWNVKPCRPAA